MDMGWVGKVGKAEKRNFSAFDHSVKRARLHSTALKYSYVTKNSQFKLNS